MTDFIKQAKEYFEQNPDKEVFCITHKDNPNHFKTVTKKAMEEYEEWAKSNIVFMEDTYITTPILNKLTLEQIKQGIEKILKERPPTYFETHPIGPGMLKLIRKEMLKSLEIHLTPGFKTLLKDEPK